MLRTLSVSVAMAIVCVAAPASAQSLKPDTAPGWYGSVGTILLTRENPNFKQLAIDNNLNPVPGFDTGLFDFDYDFGYDVTIGRQFGEWGVEARYFDVDLSSRFGTFAYDANGLFILMNQGNPAGTLGAIGAGTATGAYDSKLQSAEFNLRKQATSNIGLITGFRYLELMEEIEFDLISTGTPLDSQQFDGQNEMFGTQLGFDALLVARDWFRLTTFAKSGLFYNGQQAGSTVFLPANGLVLTSHGERSQLAYLLEAGLSTNVQLTQRLWLTAGYNVLYLDGVALASDQIFEAVPINSLGGPTAPQNVDNAQLLLHGATINLSWLW